MLVDIAAVSCGLRGHEDELCSINRVFISGSQLSKSIKRRIPGKDDP